MQIERFETRTGIIVSTADCTALAGYYETMAFRGRDAIAVERTTSRADAEVAHAAMVKRFSGYPTDIDVLGTKAAAILDTLIADLQPGQVRRVGKKGGVFMQVVVERLTDERYSVSHYLEQNGDLVPDPDIEFMRLPAGWVPLNMTQQFGYIAPVSEDENWELTVDDKVQLRGLINFVGFWLNNIKNQQDLTNLPAPS